MFSLLDGELLPETCLEQICLACQAQGGALWVMREEEKIELHLKCYRGTLDRNSLAARFSAQPSLHYFGWCDRTTAFPVPGIPKKKSFYVLIAKEGEIFGLALCSDKDSEFSESDFQAAEIVGDCAAIAMQNSLRFQKLGQNALLDYQTQVYSLTYFTDLAAKESYRSRRFSRMFSIMTLTIDGYETLRKNVVKASRIWEFTESVICVLKGVIRDSDVLARACENEYYVLLPETDFLGALLLARRARIAMERPGILLGQAQGIDIIIGLATFPRDGRGYQELIDICHHRAREARASLAKKLDLGKLDFVSAAKLLLGEEKSPPLPVDDFAGPSRRGSLPAQLMHQARLELAMEITRSPKMRGLLYMGGKSICQCPWLIEAFEHLPVDCCLRIYLLGRREDIENFLWATPVFLDGDEFFLEHELLLLYAENASYTLIQRNSSPHRACWGFHTSDAVVVDWLVTKLQEQYDLQPL
jgi:diguanylate cyclase (GGDEF)-like protein